MYVRFFYIFLNEKVLQRAVACYSFVAVVVDAAVSLQRRVGAILQYFVAVAAR